MTPNLKLRCLIWDNGSPSLDPEDYTVIDERGEKVGRRTIGAGGQQVWKWTVYGIAVTNHPPSGGALTDRSSRAAVRVLATATVMKVLLMGARFCGARTRMN
jgi:hypothetical protein